MDTVTLRALARMIALMIVLWLTLVGFFVIIENILR
jgi:hypothetical protein